MESAKKLLCSLPNMGEFSRKQQTNLRVEILFNSAKVVIGDINVAHGEQTVAEIVNAKGYMLFQSCLPPECLTNANFREAIFTRCDVCVWEDQLAMFEEAISTFGAVDIVVSSYHLFEEAS